MNKCSPLRDNLGSPSCFTPAELAQIQSALKKIRKIERLPERQIISKLNRCRTKECKTVKQNIDLTNVIKPKYKAPGVWLTTGDINDVLHQYEKKYPNFEFLGALPSDFYRIKPSSTAKHLRDISHKRYIAAIFNHGTSKSKGSHWVAFFIDIQNDSIEYFDSNGHSPTSTIYKSIRFIIDNLNLSHLSLKFNKIRYQRGNSECGVFSIFYILSRLLGHSFAETCSIIKNDDKMKAFRNYIFS